MYNQIYYSSLKDYDNNEVRIEIYKDMEGTVQAEELYLSSNPITIEYPSSDNLFEPIKGSLCTVSILTDRIFNELYTGQAQNVMIKVYKNNQLVWFGYLTPNVYSSKYNDVYEELQLEFVDVISQSEYIKFEKKQTFSSFYELFNQVLDSVDKNKMIKYIYLQQVYHHKGTYDLLNSFLCQDSNYFDEEEKSLSLKEVLESLVGYLGMTLIQVGEIIYLLDYSNIKSDNLLCIKYDRNNTVPTTITLPNPITKISEIGVAEANGSISMGNLYNKINVLANTKEIDDTLPELLDNNSLVNMDKDPNKYYTKVISDKTILSAYFRNPKFSTIEDIWDKDIVINGDNVDTLQGETFIQKNFSYITSQGEPSKINWETALTMAYDSYVGSWVDYANRFSIRTTRDFVIFKRWLFYL